MKNQKCFSFSNGRQFYVLKFHFHKRYRNNVFIFEERVVICLY